MPAAHVLLVERKSPDLFVITWWDYTGARREELASRRELSARCDQLTDPERVTIVPTPGCASYETLVGN